MPQTVLDGPLGRSATITYSYRLNTAYAPRSNYSRDLTAMQQPFFLVAGLNDQAFIAEQYQPTFSQYTQSGHYHLLPNTGHIDLLTHPDLSALIANWLTTQKTTQPN
ncbi:MAG: alpha/beta hydrolase, partial [Anaerolineales bacterium]|nr:alpha/beta hydrolase [Anaerolineales bacterium]